MGKKKNKSFYKKNVKPFFTDNKLMLAALGGLAAGISIANILGSEKAKQIVDTLEGSVKDFTAQIQNNLTHGDSEMKPKKRFEREQPA